MGSWAIPLTYVWVVKETAPNTVALFESLTPLTIIDFAISPLEDALAISFAIFVAAEVAVAVGIFFKSFSRP